jgi:WD40 repeat protein
MKKSIVGWMAIAAFHAVTLPAHADDAPRVFMQTGHSALIQAMALSPDGTQLAVADMSGAIRIWDAAQRKQIFQIGPLTMPAWSLAWSPDGRTLYSGDTKGWLGIHEPANETTVGAWQPLRSGKEARALAVRKDGLVAIGGLDREIVIYRHEDKSELARLDTGEGTGALAFSPDGSLLFSGNCEAVKAWDTRDWQVRWEVKPPDCLYALAPTPDGQRLLAAFGRFLAGSKDPRIHMLSAKDGGLLGTLEGAEGITASIQVASDGKTAVSTTMSGIPTRPIGWVPDHHVRIWDLERMALRRTMKGHAGQVMAAALAPDGRTIFTGSWDHTVRAWDMAGNLQETLEGKARLPETALETADGKYIATAFLDGAISFWDRATGELVNFHPGEERTEKFGKLLAARTAGSEMQVIAVPGIKEHVVYQAATAEKSVVLNRISARNTWATSTVVAALDAQKLADGTYLIVPEVTGAAISGNECWLAVSFTNTRPWRYHSQLSRWSCAAGNAVQASAVEMTGIVTAFALSPDGKSAVVGRKEITRHDLLKAEERHLLSAYDTTSGRVLWERPASAQVTRIALSRDGRTAFAASGFVIEVLDAPSGAQRHQLAGHNKLVTALALHERANVLASGSVDQTIVLWDLTSGKLLRRHFAHTDDVLSLAWSARHGGHLVSAGADFTVRIADHGGSGEDLALLAQFGKDDWAALTPEGYFAGSDAGIEQLGFRVGSRLYSLDQFYDVFYRPDLIQRRLRGESIAGLAPVDVAQALKAPPPEVRVEPLLPATGAESVTVRYEAIARGGGVGELRVFHNGKLVKTDAVVRPLPEDAGEAIEQYTPAAVSRSLEIKAKAPTAQLTEAGAPAVEARRDAVAIRPVAGRNEIAVIAFNGANNVQSRLRRVVFESTRPAAQARIHVLAVGINRFRAPKKWHLAYAVKDSSDFVALVRAVGAGLPAGKLGEVRLLNDSAATKNGILDALRQIAAKAGPQDVFMLFLATHGVFESGVYALLTHDYDGRVGARTTISAPELLEALRAMPAQRQVLIVDTCHAGGIDQALSGLYDSRMKVLARASGLHVLASADTLEEALDGYKGNGLFTHVLLEGVRTGSADLDADRVVSVFELGNYGRHQTAALARSLGHSQVPIMIRVGRDVPLFPAARR